MSLRQTCIRPSCSGKERDQESGNDYFGARYYANGAGRWLGADPAFHKIYNPKRLNRFTYCLNDPINCVDRDGAVAEPSPWIDEDGPEGSTTTFLNPAYLSWVAMQALGMAPDWTQQEAALRKRFDLFKKSVDKLATAPEGQRNDCQAMGQIFDAAAASFNDPVHFVQAVAGALTELGPSIGPLGSGRISDNPSFSDSGFNNQFQDSGDNQVRHFAGGVAAGFFGTLWGGAGSIAPTFLGQAAGAAAALIGMDWRERPGAPGASLADANLNSWSVRLGAELATGLIKPKDAVDFIRSNICSAKK